MFTIILTQSLNFIVMFDQIKPTSTVYVLHSRQEQSFGDQDLMKCLNLVNGPINFTYDQKQDPIFSC